MGIGQWHAYGHDVVSSAPQNTAVCLKLGSCGQCVRCNPETHCCVQGCFQKFAARLLPGAALTDGDVCEHLNAEMRPYNGTAKYMGPAAFRDFLHDMVLPLASPRQPLTLLMNHVCARVQLSHGSRRAPRLLWQLARLGERKADRLPALLKMFLARALSAMGKAEAGMAEAGTHLAALPAGDSDGGGPSQARSLFTQVGPLSDCAGTSYLSYSSPSSLRPTSGASELMNCHLRVLAQAFTRLSKHASELHSTCRGTSPGS